MSGRGRIGAVVPAAVLVLLATAAPWWTGPGVAPALAPTAAQLLPPGSVVEEAPIHSGGTVRAPGLRELPEGLEIRARGGARTVPGVRLERPPRRRRMWLGSDQAGRDLMARLAAGARTSLTVASLAAALAVLLGGTVGLAAAEAARPLRAGIVLLTDGLLALPRLLLLLILGFTLRGSAVGIGAAVGLASWMGLARVVDAEARALARSDFVRAGRASGSSAVGIAARHLLPNVAPILVTALPVAATEAILLEATLSFLGVGSGADSWGAMVADGRRLAPAGWWLVVFPGLLVCASALALHALTRMRARTDG